jgi:hypothetical protein
VAECTTVIGARSQTPLAKCALERRRLIRGPRAASARPPWQA